MWQALEPRHEIGEIPPTSAFRGCYSKRSISANQPLCRLPMETHGSRDLEQMSLYWLGPCRGQVLATGWWAGRGWLKG